MSPWIICSKRGCKSDPSIVRRCSVGFCGWIVQAQEQVVDSQHLLLHMAPQDHQGHADRAPILWCRHLHVRIHGRALIIS